MNSALPTNEAGEAVLSFWFEETKPYQWFRRDKKFDQSVKDRFGALHDAAIEHKLDVWLAHPKYSLSLIIILDQFSRNIYRDDPRAFAQDAQALDCAREAISRGFDKLVDAKRQPFFYMPFMHSEDLDVQEECVALFKARMPQADNLSYAEQHSDIIRRFGRFPHRNKILGRESTPEELAFLQSGGFNP